MVAHASGVAVGPRQLFHFSQSISQGDFGAPLELPPELPHPPSTQPSNITLRIRVPTDSS